MVTHEPDEVISMSITYRSFVPLLDQPYGEPFCMALTDREVALLRTWMRNHGKRVSVKREAKIDFDPTRDGWDPLGRNTPGPWPRSIVIHGPIGVTEGIGERVAKITPGNWALLTDYNKPTEYIKQCLKSLALGSHLIAKVMVILGEVRVYRQSTLIPLDAVRRIYPTIVKHPLYNVAVGDTIDIGPDCISEHCTADVDFLTGEGTGVVTWKYDPEVTFERVDEKTLRRLS